MPTIHDFCLIIPYGIILAAFSFAEYLKHENLAYLPRLAPGLLLLLAGCFSLRAFYNRQNSFFAQALQMAVSVRVFIDMLVISMRTEMPIIMFILSLFSFRMVLFCLYKIVHGGNQFPPEEN